MYLDFSRCDGPVKNLAVLHLQDPIKVPLTSMNNLALTYQNEGQWKEAEELVVQVMETRKRV